MQFTDLKPYKQYEFQLIASNEYGATYSEWASARTLQAKPRFIEKKKKTYIEMQIQPCRN